MKAKLILDEMPNHCGVCRLKLTIGINQKDTDYCAIGFDPDFSEKSPGEIIYKRNFETVRPDWCPLIPVETVGDYLQCDMKPCPPEFEKPFLENIEDILA